MARGDGFFRPIGCATAGPVSEFVALHALRLHLVHGETPATTVAFLDSMIACAVHVARASTSECLVTDCAVFWSVSGDCAIALVACPLHDWSFFRVLSCDSVD